MPYPPPAAQPNRMSGPPPAAAGAPGPPTASGMGGPQAGPPSGPGGPPGGALPRLVFGIESALDTLSTAVPSASGEINQIKTMLRGVLQKALNGGPASPGGMGQSPVAPPPGGGLAR